MPLKVIIVILFFNDLINRRELYQNIHIVIIKATKFLVFGIITSLTASYFITGEITRIAVYDNDPNMLAIEIVFAISIYIVFLIKYSLKKTQNILLILMLCALVFLTGSRMGFLLLLMVIFLSFVFSLRYLKKWTIFFTIGLISLMIFFSTDLARNTLEFFIQRNVALISQNDISNGRLDIWINYINIFNANKVLWLVGLGSYTYYGIEMMAHNFLIEDISSYGIIGVILIYLSYIVLFNKLFLNVKKYNKNQFYLKRYSFIVIVPLLVPIIGGITLHGLTNIPNILMIFIGIFVLIGIQNTDIGKIDIIS
jgi:O-antigen ligase